SSSSAKRCWRRRFFGCFHENGAGGNRRTGGGRIGGAVRGTGKTKDKRQKTKGKASETSDEHFCLSSFAFCLFSCSAIQQRTPVSLRDLLNALARSSLVLAAAGRACGRRGVVCAVAPACGGAGGVRGRAFGGAADARSRSAPLGVEDAVAHRRPAPARH